MSASSLVSASDELPPTELQVDLALGAVDPLAEIVAQRVEAAGARRIVVADGPDLIDGEAAIHRAVEAGGAQLGPQLAEEGVGGGDRLRLELGGVEQDLVFLAGQLVGRLRAAGDQDQADESETKPCHHLVRIPLHEWCDRMTG